MNEEEKDKFFNALLQIEDRQKDIIPLTVIKLKEKINKQHDYKIFC